MSHRGAVWRDVLSFKIEPQKKPRRWLPVARAALEGANKAQLERPSATRFTT